jgi:outer membrane protein
MNKILLLAKATITLSAMMLVFVQCTGEKADKTDNIAYDTTGTKGKLPIAYINVDSVVANYQFAKDANEELIKGQEDSRMKINVRAKKLQEDAALFESKMKNNAFLSRERAEQEQNRILTQRKELEDLNQQLSGALMSKQQKFNEQLRDTINKFFKSYAPARHFQMILSTNSMNDNVLYAVDGYDITKEVIQQLNARYKKR